MKFGKEGKRGIYVGAGAGLVLCVVVGLLPSSFVGGLLGLKIAEHIFGTPLGPAVLPRLIVGVSMLLAVLVSTTVFVAGGAMTGWTIGKVIHALKASKPITVRAYFTGRRKAKKAKGDDPGQGPLD